MLNTQDYSIREPPKKNRREEVPISEADIDKAIQRKGGTEVE